MNYFFSSSIRSIDLLPESKEAINRIQNTIIYNIEINGDGTMIHSRKIGDISDCSFKGNTNIQGDHVNQINISENTILQSALEELKQEIEAITDEEVIEDASMQYDMLLKYIEDSKPTRVQNCLTALKEIIGTTASILTIAVQLGIAL